MKNMLLGLGFKEVNVEVSQFDMPRSVQDFNNTKKVMLAFVALK
jgi:hypothetical protein